MSQFEKGLKLYSAARKKAQSLDMVPGTKSMADLIWQIQEREGNSSCFRKQTNCSETSCCWQAACGAVMTEKN